MAAPLKRALGRPVCITLQGEELFIDSLVPPYREQALALIRRQVSDVDHFIAVSEYCARYMTSFLEIPSERVSVVPLGIAMMGIRDARRLLQRTRRFGSDIWHESPRRRGCSCSRRPTSDCDDR